MNALLPCRPRCCAAPSTCQEPRSTVGVDARLEPSRGRYVHAPRRLVHWLQRSASRSWTSSTPTASWTRVRARSVPHSWTRGSICARLGRCIGSWPARRRCESGATNSSTPCTQSQNSLPRDQGRFGCIEDARGHCGPFFDWYNDEHRHSGIEMLTPAMLHYGRADEILAARYNVLQAAYLARPERFVKGEPRVAQAPTAVWINPPGTVPAAPESTVITTAQVSQTY